MIPSNRQPALNVGAFKGAKQVDPVFDNILQEVHGCFDHSTGAIRRFNGKLLNTTGVNPPIWSIAQLRFSDRIVNVRRTSSVLDVHPDYLPLPPYIPIDPFDPEDPEPPPPVPFFPPAVPDPFDPGDWPADGPKAPPVDPTTPTPAGPTFTYPSLPWNVAIRCVPASSTIDVTEGETSKTTTLEKYIDYGNWGSGEYYVRISWPTEYTWFSCGGAGNGGINSTLWLSGPLGTYEQDYTGGVSSDMPDGDYSVPVTFTLCAYTGLGTYGNLKNAQGQDITATWNVLITKYFAVLEVEPDEFDLVYIVGDTAMPSSTITVSNTGPAESLLHWTAVVSGDAGVTLDVAAGDLYGGESATITATAGAGRDVGEYTSNITISATAGSGSLTPVTVVAHEYVKDLYVGDLLFTFSFTNWPGPGSSGSSNFTRAWAPGVSSVDLAGKTFQIKKDTSGPDLDNAGADVWAAHYQDSTFWNQFGGSATSWERIEYDKDTGAPTGSLSRTLPNVPVVHPYEESYTVSWVKSP